MSDHQEIETEYERFMKHMAAELNALVRNAFGPDVIFMFAMFRAGDESRFNYISNGQREQMAILCEEMSINFKANINSTKAKQ